MLKYMVKMQYKRAIIRFYRYGLIHRKHAPAELRPDGTLYFFEYGLIHRKNGPAAILPSLYLESYFNRGTVITYDKTSNTKTKYKGQ
jgi:hypothetical protein